MRNLKRALSLALATVMTLGLMVVGTGAVGYDDVTSEDNQEAIEVLQAVGVMSGVTEDEFSPDTPVTRNQMAVIMCQLLDYTVSTYKGTTNFTDVASWALPYVEACYTNGIIAGYSDTQFGGEDPVTTGQAALMIMKALGYFQEPGDFGQDWQVATIRQGSYINLFDKVDANAEEALTRSQVAQMVLNALKANMVTFTGDVGTQLTLPDGTTYTSGYRAEYTARTNAANKYDTIDTGTTNIAQNDQFYVQLGEELYDGDLELDNHATDAFGRPARQWSYDGDEIGTYAKTELLREEYTVAVTGRDLYDLLGANTVDKYTFYISIDGIDDPDVNDTLFTKADINRSNRAELGTADGDATGNGVLTQVYVDTIAERVYIAIVNTYLAIADGDYNEKRDEVTFDVYNIHEDADGNFVKNDNLDDRMTITSEDFAIASDIADGDAFLVNVADGEIKAMAEPTLLSEVEIESFSPDNHLTVDGTKYPYAETARYDTSTLNNFTVIGNQNLKDTVYNVYVDAYDNMIGVEEVDPADNYLFITGMNNGYSNMASREVRANAIFLDGTMKPITINTVDSQNLSSAWPGNNDAIVNSWFTYTVNSDEVYTVSRVNTPIGGGSVGQYRTDSTYDDAISDENIDLPGAVSGSYQFVYGNDSSVYLTVEIKEINSRENEKDRVISDVKSVTVGVDNTSIEVWDAARANSEASDSTVDGVLQSGGAYGVYTLYDDEAYVIAAVVVGDDGGTGSDYVYVNSTTGSIVESYNKTTEKWTWTRDVLINGEVVTLKEVRDTEMSCLEDMDQYKWYRVTYNADGEVKSVTSFDDTVNTGILPDGNDSILLDSDFDDWYTTSKNLPQDHVATTDIEDVPNQYANDVIIYHHVFTNRVPTVNKDRTFYVDNSLNTGVRVDSNVNVVFIQDNDNRTTTEYGTGIDFLTDVLSDLHEATTAPTVTYNYQVAMMFENARATTVIIRDTVDTYVQPPVVGDFKVTQTSAGAINVSATDDTGAVTVDNAKVVQVINGTDTNYGFGTATLTYKLEILDGGWQYDSTYTRTVTGTGGSNCVIPSDSFTLPAALVPGESYRVTVTISNNTIGELTIGSDTFSVAAP